MCDGRLHGCVSKLVRRAQLPCLPAHRNEPPADIKLVSTVMISELDCYAAAEVVVSLAGPALVINRTMEYYGVPSPLGFRRLVLQRVVIATFVVRVVILIPAVKYASRCTCGRCHELQWMARNIISRLPHTLYDLKRPNTDLMTA